MEKEIKKQKKSKRIRKYNLVSIFGVAFVFCSIFYIVSLQMTLFDKKSQLQKLKSQISVVEINNANLSDILEKGNENEIIEKIAREEFNYLAPGERVFYDLSGN